jgi:hypothetical protein
MKFFNAFMLIAVLVIFIPISNISAQEEDNNSFPDEFWDEEFNTSSMISQPSIEVIYGMGMPAINKSHFSSDFNEVNSLEVRFGFISKKEKLFSDNIYEYGFPYFFLGNISSNWSKAPENESPDIGTEAWQFGFGMTGGYGYNLSDNISLVLYNCGAIAWTKTDFKNLQGLFPDDEAKLDYIGNSFRFGDYSEGGIRLWLFDHVAISTGYQRILVLPRHLFWKWLGGGVIESVGSGIISWFSGKVMDSSPVMGPIVFFVLKNAYSYGMYELRKTKMNWPFNTEAPLMYDDNIKIGVSFAF